MNDSIFIILHGIEVYTNLYSIYENVENNGIMKWSYICNFGETDYDFVMPPVIRSIEIGKFFFFPQETKTRPKPDRAINMTFVNPIELWTKNKTLTRSPFEFPKSLRPNNKTLALLILQI